MSTTSPTLRSFITVKSQSHFPIQNLPYGVFRPSAAASPRVGVAIGDDVLDLSVLEHEGLLRVGSQDDVFSQPSINRFMALGRDVWSEVRATISHLLEADVTTLRDNASLRANAITPMSRVEMLMPVEIGDYTDFYSSRDHATNVGTMMRGPDNALMPNWLHLPVAYHGRSSSVIVSGTDIRRPCGQRMTDGQDRPVFGPTRSLDFELEMGFVVGTGSSLGEPISTDRALEHIFGMVIVNDWSARDIQKWEYQPLGPFLSKNFATSISPWVVPLEALEPFSSSGAKQDPTPLAYLEMPDNKTFDIRLEVSLQAEGAPHADRICTSNLHHIYWDICQQVAHHTITGCNLCTGDLLATGTISGPTPDSLGCLLELTKGGREPIDLSGGQSRRFLEDGDRVMMTGWCDGNTYRVGFGEVCGNILPAMEPR